MTFINIPKKISLLLTSAIAAVMMQSVNAYVYGAAEDFTTTIPHTSENGIITLNSGQQWFKATELENGRNYLIGIKCSDGSSVLLTADDHTTAEYIWHYAEDKMVSSTSYHYNELYTDTHRLCCHNNDLYLTKDWWSEGDETWNFDGKRLFHNSGGTMTYLTYTEGSSVPFGCTGDPAKAADVEIFTNGPELARCIKTQPCAESFVIEGSGYAPPVFSVELLNDSITADSIRWFTDGEEKSAGGLAFTAEELAGLPAGVHHVSCIVEAHDADNHYYREKSQEAVFVVTKGIVPDSVITFSDIHEQYDLIGKAIEGVLERTGGYIPSLIVCTGDMINGPTMDYDTMINTYAPRLKPYLGGLDTVFVAGNHDSSKAVSELSQAAGLGADSDFSDGCGIIYRSSPKKGKNSTAAKNIIVYGINYASLEAEKNGITVQDYNNIKEQIESFLAETAKDYNGELIIFSAHAGLHVIGVQPQSGYYVGQWAGSSAYNIANSYDMAKLLNTYAQKYNMNILYLFGHDHSRGEKEFILSDGEQIICATDPEARATNTVTLAFTYAHSGYLSSVIGSADAGYSFIYINGDTLTYELFRAGSPEYVTHKEIALKPNSKAKASPQTGTAASSGSKKNSSPKTSARSRIAPLMIISLSLFFISRRSRK